MAGTSGFARKFAAHPQDQSFSRRIDEFFVIAQFVEFPPKVIAQPGFLVPAQFVFPAEIGGARKYLFEYAGQALWRNHLRGIVGDCGRIAFRHFLCQAFGEFSNFAGG